jgi:hypothetical protein
MKQIEVDSKLYEENGTTSGLPILCHLKDLIECEVIEVESFLADLVEIDNSSPEYINIREKSRRRETDKHCKLKLIVKKSFGNKEAVYDFDNSGFGPDVIIGNIPIECGNFAGFNEWERKDESIRRLVEFLNEIDEVWHFPYTYFDNRVVFRFTRGKNFAYFDLEGYLGKRLGIYYQGVLIKDESEIDWGWHRCDRVWYIPETKVDWVCIAGEELKKEMEKKTQR